VTLFVEFSLNDDEGLSMAGEPSDLCLVHQEHFTDEAIEVRDPLVRRGVRPYHWVIVGLSSWIPIDLHDLRAR
jgi:hypothetical protein